MNESMNESMNECVSFGFHCLYVALFLLLSDIGFLCLSGFFELILSGNVKQARTFFRFLFPASSFLLYRALSLFTCAHTHTHRRARTHTHAHTQIHTLPKKKLGVTHSYTLFTQLYTLNIPFPFISFFRIFNYILFLFFSFFFVFVFYHYVIFFSFCISSFPSLDGINTHSLTHTHTHTHKIIKSQKHTHKKRRN